MTAAAAAECERGKKGGETPSSVPVAQQLSHLTARWRADARKEEAAGQRSPPKQRSSPIQKQPASRGRQAEGGGGALPRRLLLNTHKQKHFQTWENCCVCVSSSQRLNRQVSTATNPSSLHLPERERMKTRRSERRRQRRARRRRKKAELRRGCWNRREQPQRESTTARTTGGNTAGEQTEPRSKDSQTVRGETARQRPEATGGQQANSRDTTDRTAVKRQPNSQE